MENCSLIGWPCCVLLINEQKKKLEKVLNARVQQVPSFKY